MEPVPILTQSSFKLTLIVQKRPQNKTKISTGFNEPVHIGLSTPHTELYVITVRYTLKTLHKHKLLTYIL